MVQPGPGFRTGTRVTVQANGSPAGWETQSCNRKKQDSGQEGRNRCPDREKRGKLTPDVAKDGSRKHRPADVQGVTGISETHPASLFPSHTVTGVSNSNCSFWRLAAPWASVTLQSSQPYPTVAFHTHKILLQGCDSHGHKTLGSFAVLNSHYTLICITARMLPYESPTRLRAGNKTPTWVLSPPQIPSVLQG